MFILLFAIVGAGVTFLLLWQFGASIALLGAPFGGSVAAGLAALLLAVRKLRNDRALDQAARDQQQACGQTDGRTQ